VSLLYLLSLVTRSECHSSKTIVLKDLQDSLVGVLSTEARPFIVDRLKPFKGILQRIFPESFVPVDSSKLGFKFKNVHLDVYNRYGESVGIKNSWIVLSMLKGFDRAKAHQRTFILTTCERMESKTLTTPSAHLTLLKLLRTVPRRTMTSWLPFETSALTSVISSRSTYQTSMQSSLSFATSSLSTKIP
jgi:hypothetical protein